MILFFNTYKVNTIDKLCKVFYNIVTKEVFFMFCTNCGGQIDDNAYVCIHCGVKVNNQPKEKHTADTGSFWWGVLGYFVPIAGLIIWLTCRDNTPKNAKSAGIGALVSVIVNILLSIVVIVFYAFIFTTALATLGSASML